MDDSKNVTYTVHATADDDTRSTRCGAPTNGIVIPTYFEAFQYGPLCAECKELIEDEPINQGQKTSDWIREREIAIRTREDVGKFIRTG